MNQTITLENQKRMMLNVIIEVLIQVDKCVIAKTNGKQVIISGVGLRVTKLSLEEGIMIVDGTIESFKYNEISSKGFFKRLFK